MASFYVPDSQLGALRAAGINCRVKYPLEMRKDIQNGNPLSASLQRKVDAYIYALSKFKTFFLTANKVQPGSDLAIGLGSEWWTIDVLADYHNDSRGSNKNKTLAFVGNSVTGLDENGDHWTLELRNYTKQVKFHLYLPDTVYSPAEIFPARHYFLRKVVFEKNQTPMGTRGVHFTLDGCIPPWGMFLETYQQLADELQTATELAEVNAENYRVAAEMRESNRLGYGFVRKENRR